MTTFRAAAIQMTSGDNIAANIAQLAPLVEKAAKAGAQFIATPENSFYMRREGTAALADVPLAQHEGIRWAQKIAAQHKIYLLIGSVRARDNAAEKATNRSVLIAPDGSIAATYDKMHLFDVTVPGGQSYRESSQAMAGDVPVLAKTPLAAIGLTICYDVRFPNLYRALALAGAEILAVPSAFTVPTGQAHWHSLLRARAIENACYVIAPAQCGEHPGGRSTYGHSLIIDPWGEVIAECVQDVPGIITAEIDLAHVATIRAQLPVLQHHRALPEVRVF
jgi:predicted amidohydrolase